MCEQKKLSIEKCQRKILDGLEKFLQGKNYIVLEEISSTTKKNCAGAKKSRIPGKNPESKKRQE